MAEANFLRFLQQIPTAATLRYGYCHVCDRQVPIRGTENDGSLECTVCNGGFVELLDEEATNPTAEQQQQGNANTNQQQPQRRPNDPPIFTFRSMQQPNVNSQRIEFVVPGGEQLDFYGMLNNIITGLLGPNAQMQQQAGGPGQGFIPIQMFQIRTGAGGLGGLHGAPGDYAWGPGGLDAILTQLLNQLEQTGPAPATDAQINSLPFEVITNEHLEKADQCAICMDEYKKEDKARKLPCKHYFHESCITEWLKLHGTCPVCRKTLSGEDTSQNQYVAPAGAGGQSNNQQQQRPSNTDNNRNNPSSNNRNNNNNYYEEPDFD